MCVIRGLKEFADWPTFPQTCGVQGELVGGLDIIVSFALLFFLLVGQLAR